MTQKASFTIKELPADERPREKLIVHGADSLSNAELLAILLRTGTVNDSAIRIAESLLIKFHGLVGLGGLSAQELSKIKGIGLAKAVTIIAAMELSKRMNAIALQERPTIKTPQDAAALMMARLRYESKEKFLALLLSTKNHIIATPVISVGTLDASLVHPRELFREAINYAAASIILVHNHPSGDPTPSPEDIELTNKLTSAGELLGIKILDHIIIGCGKYVSMKEKGII